MDNVYLLQKLETGFDQFGRSFSCRYMNWKRRSTLIRSLQKELIKRKGQSARIIDIGCNEGDLLFVLSHQFGKSYDIHLTGVDLSPLNIDFANKRKEYYHHTNCDFSIMDANHLAFNPEHFDIVICSEVLEHMQEPAVTVKEIHRILKKNGLAVITSPNGGGNIVRKIIHALNFITSGRLMLSREKDIQELKEMSSDTVRQGQKEKNIGSGHISVKDRKEWLEIFDRCGFALQRCLGTGGMVFGDPTIDKHRILFALTVIADTLIEKLPGTYYWSEILQFELRKTSG
jgi:2-polyprenyl-3-methyl-5-hydroxy-6-metoxy-1,4-benzoquinol methylase